MIYLIGKPGEPRIFLTTDDYSSAVLQCQEGEVIEEVEAVPVYTAPRDYRAERDAMLAGSDWTQLPDASLSPEALAAWTTYRQALRDIDFDDPVWPEVPPN